jgi:lipopolysaccharide transport system ATP-binding protein
MENSPSITLKDVAKYYHLSKISPLRSLGAILRGSVQHEEKMIIRALEGVSLTAKEGERLGIIGPNGAGKTTLLSIIAGFAQCTKGSVDIQGTVNAIMTIGVGIREEMTGIENIHLDGELHGYGEEEIKELLPEVVAFADLGEYIHRPVRTYSSGMKARLSFALLSFVKPEILIIDEVLGVGDAEFAVKSAQKIEALCSMGKILIVVSHSMATITRLCTRALWLEGGRIAREGEAVEVTGAYIESVRVKKEKELKNRFLLRVEGSIKQSRASVEHLVFHDDRGEEKAIFQLREEARVIITIKAIEALEGWDLCLSFIKIDGMVIMKNGARDEGAILSSLAAGEQCTVEAGLGRLSFAEGVYEVLCELLIEGEVLAARSTVLKVENLKEFALSKPDYYCSFQFITG